MRTGGAGLPDGFVTLLKTALAHYGVASLEALSCGVPTFVYLHRTEAAAADLPPVFNAHSSEEIAAALMAFTAHPDLETLRAASRRWTLSHHSFAAVRPRYEAFYRTAIARSATGDNAH